MSWIRARTERLALLAALTTAVLTVALPPGPSDATAPASHGTHVAGHPRARQSTGVSPRHHVLAMPACPAARPGRFTCDARVAARRLPDGRLVPLTASTPGATWYTPTDLHAMYGLYPLAALDGSTPGAGETVAIIDSGDSPTVVADYQAYRSYYSLGAESCGGATPRGCLTVYNQNGKDITANVAEPGLNAGLSNGVPKVDGSKEPGHGSWESEIALDTEAVAAVCPACDIDLYLVDNSSSLFTGVQAAVDKGERFVSMSFGAKETAGETAEDPVLRSAAAAGTFFAASTGDSSYRYGVQYPSASPYVLAVGGTSVYKSGSTYSSSVWGTSLSSGAGSGCSKYEPKPAWQDGLIPDSVCSTRAVADISAIADPATGIAVLLGTGTGSAGWTEGGGTSLAAPVITAMAALNGVVANPHGSAAWDPYDSASALTDVTTGATGPCASVPAVLCTGGIGWDGPSGLGTPNSAAVFDGVGGDPVQPTLAGLDFSPVTAVPGLPFTPQVSLSPALVASGVGTTWSWRSSRSDCGFSSTTAETPTVSCNASDGGTFKLIATVVIDGEGTISGVIPVTFATAAQAAPRISTTIGGSSAATTEVCTGEPAYIQAAVTTAGGQPVKGVTVAFKVGTGPTAKLRQVTAKTDASGHAVTKLTWSGTAVTDGYVSVTTIGAGRMWPAQTTAVTQSATSSATACAPRVGAVTVGGSAVTGTSSETVWPGQPISYATQLTDGSGAPLTDYPVQLQLQPLTGPKTVLTQGTTDAAGDVVLTYTPTKVVSGTVMIAPLKTGYVTSPTSMPVGSLTVPTPTLAFGSFSMTTSYHPAVDTADFAASGVHLDTVMPGEKPTLFGHLTGSWNGSSTPVPGVTVRAYVVNPVNHGHYTVGTAVTNGFGGFAIALTPNAVASGALYVTSGTSRGWPVGPATAVTDGSGDASTLTYQPWVASVSFTPTSGSATGTTSLTGTLTLDTTGVDTVPRSAAATKLAVQMYFTPSGGTAARTGRSFIVTSGTPFTFAFADTGATGTLGLVLTKATTHTALDGTTGTVSVQ